MNRLLADAGGVIPPQPASLDPSRRSLSCHDCRCPIPAGTVRCRPCFSKARRSKEKPPVKHTTSDEGSTA